MHVEEVEGVGGFVTIEHALLDHDHPVAIGATIDDAGAHTATGALTTGDEGIDAQVVQVPCQPTAARPRLDSLQERFRLVPKPPPVQVNEEQSRSLSEANTPVRAQSQMCPVLLGEITVPYACWHRLPPSLRCHVGPPTP